MRKSSKGLDGLAFFPLPPLAAALALRLRAVERVRGIAKKRGQRQAGFVPVWNLKSGRAGRARETPRVRSGGQPDRLPGDAPSPGRVLIARMVLIPLRGPVQGRAP